jgi:hypothetical protein
MPELVRKSVGLPWICAWGGGDRSVELKHKLMLGMIGATLGVLLQGCTANKPPSEGETSVANAAKDVVIPLEAGKDLARNAAVRMRVETPASGGACIRLPWTCTQPTCSTGATGTVLDHTCGRCDPRESCDDRRL